MVKGMATAKVRGTAKETVKEKGGFDSFVNETLTLALELLTSNFHEPPNFIPNLKRKNIYQIRDRESESERAFALVICIVN